MKRDNKKTNETTVRIPGTPASAIAFLRDWSTFNVDDASAEIDPVVAGVWKVTLPNDEDYEFAIVYLQGYREADGSIREDDDFEGQLRPVDPGQYVDPSQFPVFVYGSLLSGLGNHPFIVGGTFLSPAIVPGKFKMIDLGSFPAVFRDDDGCDIIGEVYQVDGATLRRLDRLESNGRFYTRELVECRYPASSIRGQKLSEGEGERVWVYLLNDPKTWDHTDAPRVANNNWRTK